MALKEKISDISAIGGDTVFLLFVFVAAAAGLKSVVLVLLASWLMAYAITFAIRMVWWQERPDKESYKNIWQKFDAGSFPSLHAMRATILMASLASFYHNPLATAGFAVAVAAVCYARVWLKRHRLIDILAGVPLGLAAYWLAPKIINALHLI